jgi:hypothetical protein
MKINLRDLTFLMRLTVAGLTGCAFAIWTQWLSGDPAYRTFPPGPVFFIAVAAVVDAADRIAPGTTCHRRLVRDAAKKKCCDLLIRGP